MFVQYWYSIFAVVIIIIQYCLSLHFWKIFCMFYTGSYITLLCWTKYSNIILEILQYYSLYRILVLYCCFVALLLIISLYIFKFVSNLTNIIATVIDKCFMHS